MRTYREFACAARLAQYLLILTMSSLTLSLFSPLRALTVPIAFFSGSAAMMCLLVAGLDRRLATKTENRMARHRQNMQDGITKLHDATNNPLCKRTGPWSDLLPMIHELLDDIAAQEPDRRLERVFLDDWAQERLGVIYQAEKFIGLFTSLAARSIAGKKPEHDLIFLCLRRRIEPLLERSRTIPLDTDRGHESELRTLIRLSKASLNER